MEDKGVNVAARPPVNWEAYGLKSVIVPLRSPTWIKQMNEDMKQMSKGYETKRTKGTFKTRRQTKQIYIYNKTYIDALKYRYGSINKIVMCVYVCVCV